MSMQSLQAPLIATLNHLLSRQPAVCAVLKAHAGKSALIDAGLLQLHLAVAADGLLQTVVANGDMAVTTGSSNVGNETKDINDTSATKAANVTISLRPADLPLMLANKDRAFSYVNIRGDAEFARAISEVANHLQWEAEEDLAPLVGDIAAVRMVQAARATTDQIGTGSRKLIENLAEYLLEENPTLLYRKAGDDFAAKVASLRDDVERITKRIAQLETKAGSST